LMVLRDSATTNAKSFALTTGGIHHGSETERLRHAGDHAPPSMKGGQNKCWMRSQAGYRVAPHTHPVYEVVTVISGTFRRARISPQITAPSDLQSIHRRLFLCNSTWLFCSFDGLGSTSL